MRRGARRKGLQTAPIFFTIRRLMQEDKVHLRPIRSYVRRAGRLTPSQRLALEELWPTMGLAHSDGLLDFAAIFGRVAPIVLEIGFGDGETLVQLATENPDKNYVGIEVHEPGVGHCLLKARDAGLKNLRLLMHDAIEVLNHQIPAASLSRVNLYFPDPWPKKRHHKRRIVQDNFLNTIAERLCQGGTLNIATDWADYAHHIDDVFSHSERFSCTERREHQGERPLDRPQTKFERRGLKRGYSICDWCFTKSADS
jgi:tRNA (guanine-N7-)-methyltransferase